MTKGKPKRFKCNDRDMEALLREAERLLGAENVTGGGRRHYRMLVPGKGVVFGPSTPSDHRSVKDVRAKLRRLGVQV